MDTAPPADPVDVDAATAPDRSRTMILVAALATLLPIWILAIRVGVRGMVPVGDTAIMALRAPDVFSTRPPMIGMPASSASAAEVVHFPGAWQLYWMAGPVELFGPTWGTVLSMAALNSIWIGLTIWLVYRNLDTARALVTIALIGVFAWSIGTGMFIEAWPLRMVMVPFVCVVFAAWFTAVGDRAALVVLAVAANYAWLDHLVLGIAVPMVALTGCVGFLAGHVRANRNDPAGRAGRRRRFGRSVAAAGAVTFVMWLPALIEQVTHSPGNLELVFGRSEGASPPLRSWTAAVHVVASVVGRPPFWLRGTLEDPTFYRPGFTDAAVGSATWFDLAFVVVLIGGLVALAVLTVRRRDRIGAALVAVAATAVLASLVTTWFAPGTTAVVPEYLHSVWVTGLVVWTCVVVVVLRTVRGGGSYRVAGVGLVLAVVFGVLNVPMSHTGYTARPRENELARQMSDAVITDVAGLEPVGVTLANLFGNANFLSALLVEMRHHDVVYCFPTPNSSLYDFIPDCRAPGATIVIGEQSRRDPPEGDVTFSERMFPDVSADDVADLRRRIEDWLAGRTELELTDEAKRPFLGDMIPRQLTSRAERFEPVDGNLAHLVDDASFREMIGIWWNRSNARGAPLFVDQPVSPAELYRWASRTDAAEATLWATRVDPASTR